MPPRPVRTFYLIRQAQLAAQWRLEVHLHDLGLTPTQYTVLSLSGAAAGEGPSSAELARRAGVSAQSMNEVIAALEGKGLIRRREAAANRRILRIRLTPQGTALLARAEAVVDDAEAELLAPLGTAELAQLRGLLRAVLDRREDRQAAEAPICHSE